MQVAKRCLAGGLAVAGLHVALAGLLVGQTLRLAAYFALCALLTAAVAVLLYRLLTGPPGGGGGGGGDHGGPPRDEPPEPPWWPAFERELRAYERRRDRPPEPV